MRGLLRTRKQIVRERASHIQRLQKTLEDANIKLDFAISDIVGVSGRAMIEALIAGTTDPDELAALAHRRIKAPGDTLREALRGRVTKHHRFLLRLHLQQIDTFDTAIAEIDAEVDANVEPFRTAIRLLTTIPGVSDLSARDHRGRDRHRHEPLPHRWPSDFLGGSLSPERRKRRETPIQPHAERRSLAQDRPDPVRLGRGPQEGRLSPGSVPPATSPAGAKKAIGAVAASILTAIHHMLTNGTLFHDMGGDYFDKRENHTSETSHPPATKAWIQRQRGAGGCLKRREILSRELCLDAAIRAAFLSLP